MKTPSHAPRALLLASLWSLSSWSLSSCGGGGSDGGGDSNENPITERPARGSRACRVTHPVAEQTPRVWRSGPALVATRDGKAFLARQEAVTADPVIPATGQFIVGGLGVDGTFAAATPVPSGAMDELADIDGAPRGDGFAVVWGQQGKLRFAAFDAAGASTIAAKDVLSVAEFIVGPRIAAGPDGGFGVVYTVVPNPNARTLFFVLLGPDGEMRGTPHRLDETGTSMQYLTLPAPTIVGGTAGYAMIWRNLTEAQGGIEFAKVAPDGAELVARRRISTPMSGSVVGASVDFDRPTTAMVETSTGYLTAWVNTKGDGSSVWLTQLDASGVRQGPSAPLRAWTDKINEVEPSLVKYGDSVAVLWGSGSHIFVCGGCTPDHRIDLLLVDPSDLTPLSTVVSVAPPPREIKTGGLLRRQVVAIGPSLLATFDITFHVHHLSATATFGCDP